MASVTGQFTHHLLGGREALETGLPDAPYPGLRSFTMDEWPIFFGRETAIEDVLSQLNDTEFVMIHGASGCGKSSLVYAGVLPRLVTQSTYHRQRLALAQMRPGNAPLSSLAAALAAGVGRKEDERQLYLILNRGMDAAPDIRKYMSEAGFDRFCLYIDQFEELFRFSQDDEHQVARFVKVLVGLANLGPPKRPWWRAVSEDEKAAESDNKSSCVVRIIATMRSEFFGDCGRSNELAKLVNGTQYLLPPMGSFDMERAIREPAELYGYSVERKLALQFISEADREIDPLPLIQHALMLLWEKGGRSFTVVAYSALASVNRAARSQQTGLIKTNLGRVFADHVDQVIGSGENRLDVAEMLFRALVNIDSQRRATRRPQPLSKLIDLVGEDNELTLRSLIDDMCAEGASFLRPIHPGEGALLPPNAIIDIGHEALFRAWPSAADPSLDSATNLPRGWLLREYEDGLIWRALAVHARAHDQNRAELLDSASTLRHVRWFARVGARAAWAERHLIEHQPDIPADEQREWLSVRSLIEESDRKARRGKWLWWLGIGGVALLGIVIVVAMAAVISSRSREKAAKAGMLASRAQVAALKLQRKLENAESTISQLTAFIALGSDQTSKVKLASTDAAVPPSTLQIGDRVRLRYVAVVRSASPASDNRLAPGRGFLPVNATVTIASKPIAIRQNDTLFYWARVEGGAIPFGTVRIRYTGRNLSNTRADLSNRGQRLKAELIHLGFRIEQITQDAGASGKSEVRFYRSNDLSQASVLSYLLRSIVDTARIGDLDRIPSVRDLSRTAPVQTNMFDIWIDLGSVKAAAPRPLPTPTTPGAQATPDGPAAQATSADSKGSDPQQPVAPDSKN